ncbi:DUF6345 domain-containing protein [Thermodesulfobacteriota bacterium]
MRSILFVLIVFFLMILPVFSSANIHSLTKEQFDRFCRTIQVDGGQPAVKVFRHWIQAKTPKWIYTIDTAGNQCLRPESLLPYIEPSLSGKPVDEKTALSLTPDTHQWLVARVWVAATKLIGNPKDWYEYATVKKEVVLAGKCGAKVRLFPGRILVRLSDREDVAYFQMVFTPRGDPVRVDTNVSSNPLPPIVALHAGVASNNGAFEEWQEKIGFGMFFDPDEYRFEINAHSYEGEPFLSPTETNIGFGNDKFDVRFPHLVNVTQYRKSKDYKSWCWHWWSIYGRVNGARGNWDQTLSRWQNQHAGIRHHRSLKEYRLVGGEPGKTKNFQQPDGKTYRYPHAAGRQMEKKFYNDLEECHVALLFTHGGPIDNRLQLRRGLDVWFSVGQSHYKFGRGRLRHLFIQGCSAMTCFKQRDVRLATEEWMTARYVKGLRTICGVDGESVGLERDGWRFFGYYHKGNSISDAWALAVIDEYPQNAPATAAYGRTMQEAIETLFEGRFSVERAKPRYCAVSVWVANEGG